MLGCNIRYILKEAMTVKSVTRMAEQFACCQIKLV